MIHAKAFFSETINTVDAVIGHFVHTAYQHLVVNNSALISMLFTFYIMILGYQFLFRVHHFDLSMVMRRLIGMLCVYALAMNWELYYLFVYNIFTNEPGNIAHVLISAADSNHAGASLTQAMDEIYASVLAASKGFFSQVGFSMASISFITYGILVYLIGTIMCVFALLLFIYAKMMMAIALALGPIFILFYLWDNTRGLFQAWIRKLITIALIPIVTSSVLVLMLSVINVTLPNIKVPTQDMQFYGIAPFLGLNLATAMILTQVFRICASLGGGLTLASISSGASIVQSVLPRFGSSNTKQQYASKPSSNKNKPYKKYPQKGAKK